MYNNEDNVAGASDRKINFANVNAAGDFGRKDRNNNVAGEARRIRCDCECVFECLLELLEDALDDKKDCRRDRVSPGGGRRCECVYECLLELLEDALEKDKHHHCRKR
ncbi:hypothetical protein [Sedimentibacter sp.]|uniref:hypothetical protein n=1 Tax=Sedimentibacter sp. TaxID=1960295 RepID=UPI0028A5F1AF|nr:hypothetical protein [Sedimentibacter sp.]